MISQLPPESAVATARRLEGDSEHAPTERPDPETEQWSRPEHLLASIRDEMHMFRYHYIQAHSKSRLQWKPEPLPRPGISGRRSKSALAPEQLSVLSEHLARTQGQLPAS